jgi:hypothetical protein
MKKLSIEECRTLLGDAAQGKTDEQIEVFRNELVTVANQMYDHLQSKVRVERDTIEAGNVGLPGIPSTSEIQLKSDSVERIKWTAYMHETTDDEDAL